MTTIVYVFGSGECEQLGLGDDIMESKKGRKISMFDGTLPAVIESKLSIVKILCGGMHTLALSSNGNLYSWGCNDDNVLGRSGVENVPAQVMFPSNGNEKSGTITDISTGDTHSVAYNTETNQIFFWGCYRTDDGKYSTKFEKPVEFASDIFNASSKSRIKKVVSGAQHTVVLSLSGEIFTCGDSQQGKLGRHQKTRKSINFPKIDTNLQKIGAKNAKDIFCGRHHSFYIKKTHQVYAWGMNNHGQLGLNSKIHQTIPKLVNDLNPYEGDYFVSFKGGEHHTIGLMKSGCVYCFGNNEEGQIGLGDLFGEYNLKKRENQKNDQTNLENQNDLTESNIKQTTTGVKKRKKYGSSKPKQDQDDLKNIGWFLRPRLNDTLWKLEVEQGEDESTVQKKITQISSAGNYCYALIEDKNEVYAWGFGEWYVLGNRDDRNEHKPCLLDKRMFENNRVLQVACGTNHIVVLATTEENQIQEVKESKETEDQKMALKPDKQSSKKEQSKQSQEQVLGSKTKNIQNAGNESIQTKTNKATPPLSNKQIPDSQATLKQLSVKSKKRSLMQMNENDCIENNEPIINKDQSQTENNLGQFKSQDDKNQSCNYQNLLI